VEPERCAECGFDGTRLSAGDAIAALRTLGPRWRQAFKDRPDEILRSRPAPNVWSPLEYAAHTRDVLMLNGLGMHEILRGHSPELPPVEPDEEAADHGYNELDPNRVLDELDANARRIADRASRVVGAEPWTRSARIGGRDVDAGWVLRHALHDATHHLRDVERILRPDETA
jgi:hypothetical protein